MTLQERARVWAGMLTAALERRDYAAAQGYARHLERMTVQLRKDHHAMTAPLATRLQAFHADHADHGLDFESQDYIACADCQETLTLPEGSGVRLTDDESMVFVEVPSGIANGHVTYTLDLTTGSVSL